MASVIIEIRFLYEQYANNDTEMHKDSQTYMYINLCQLLHIHTHKRIHLHKGTHTDTHIYCCVHRVMTNTSGYIIGHVSEIIRCVGSFDIINFQVTQPAMMRHWIVSRRPASNPISRVF